MTILIESFSVSVRKDVLISIHETIRSRCLASQHLSCSHRRIQILPRQGTWQRFSASVCCAEAGALQERDLAAALIYPFPLSKLLPQEALANLLRQIPHIGDRIKPLFPSLPRSRLFSCTYPVPPGSSRNRIWRRSADQGLSGRPDRRSAQSRAR